MEGQVNLLGVNVELANAVEAMERTKAFLEDDKRHVIRFVDTKACTLAAEDEYCARLIAESDYILPADLSTEEGVKELVTGYREVFWHEDYFDALFQYAVDESKELYFVTRTNKKYQDLAERVHAKFPYLSIHGKALEDMEDMESYEALANDINAVAPDILFFYVSINHQNELLEECSAMINTSLLICGSGMLSNSIDEPQVVSEDAGPLEKKFGQSLIIFLKRIHTTVVGALFKKRVKDSRKEEENGDQE